MEESMAPSPRSSSTTAAEPFVGPNSWRIYNASCTPRNNALSSTPAQDGGWGEGIAGDPESEGVMMS